MVFDRWQSTLQHIVEVPIIHSRPKLAGVAELFEVVQPVCTP
jgi:hypothetical protein